MSTWSPGVLKQVVILFLAYSLTKKKKRNITEVETNSWHSKWMETLKQLKFTPLCTLNYSMQKVSLQSSETLKKKKQTAKTRKVIKTSTLLCYKYWKYVSKCDKKYYERLQMHKWSKCNTLSSEAPIKKDYYKALQNNFFIQKLWSSY